MAGLKHGGRPLFVEGGVEEPNNAVVEMEKKKKVKMELEMRWMVPRFFDLVEILGLCCRLPDRKKTK